MTLSISASVAAQMISTSCLSSPPDISSRAAAARSSPQQRVQIHFALDR
jgi:hypothetical protein